MYCFISGCPNSNDSSKDSRKARMVQIFFSAPEDEALFKQWQIAVPGKNRTFSRIDKLCDFHFKKSEVVLFNETKLPNGNVRRVPALEPKLKAGTVPSIFPDVKEASRKIINTEVQKSTPKRKLSSSDESEIPNPTPRPRGRPRKIPNVEQEKNTPITPTPQKKKKIQSESDPLIALEEKQYKEIESDEESDPELTAGVQPSIRLVPLEVLLASSQSKKKGVTKVEQVSKSSPAPKSVLQSRKRKAALNSKTIATGKNAKRTKVVEPKKKVQQKPFIKPMESRKKAREDIEEICSELELGVGEVSDDENGVYEIERITDPGSTQKNDQIYEILSIKSDPDEIDIDQKKSLEELNAELADYADTETLNSTSSECSDISDSKSPLRQPRITEVISLQGLDDDGNVFCNRDRNVDNIEMEIAKMLGESDQSETSSDHEGSGAVVVLQSKSKESDKHTLMKDLTSGELPESKPISKDRGISSTKSNLAKNEDSVVEKPSKNITETQSDSEQRASKESVTESNLPNESDSEHNIPEDSSSEQQLSKESGSDKKTLKENESEPVSKDTASKSELSSDSVSELQASKGSKSEQSVSKDTSSELPKESDSVEGVPTDTSSEPGLLKETSPVQSIPKESGTEQSVTKDSISEPKLSTESILEQNISKGDPELQGTKDGELGPSEKVSNPSIKGGELETPEKVCISEPQISKGSKSSVKEGRECGLETLEKESISEPQLSKESESAVKEGELEPYENDSKLSPKEVEVEPSKQKSISESELSKESDPSLNEGEPESSEKKSKPSLNEGEPEPSEKESEHSLKECEPVPSEKESEPSLKEGKPEPSEKVSEPSLNEGEPEPSEKVSEPSLNEGEPVPSEKEGEPSLNEGEPEPSKKEGEPEPSEKESEPSLNEGEPVPSEKESEPSLNEGEPEPCEKESEPEPSEKESEPSLNEGEPVPSEKESEPSLNEGEPEPCEKESEPEPSEKESEPSLNVGEPVPSEKEGESEPSEKVSKTKKPSETPSRKSSDKLLQTPNKTKRVKKRKQFDNHVSSDDEVIQSPEVVLDISSDSEADPTWAPTADAIEVSDDNDTDPGSDKDGSGDSDTDKRNSNKGSKKSKRPSTPPSTKVAPTEVSKLLTQEALQQILKKLKFPLEEPVEIALSMGSRQQRDRAIAPRGKIPISEMKSQNENSHLRTYKSRPSRKLQISAEKSKKCTKLLGLRMFEGLGKIKKALDFSTFLSDVEDELQFKKFCLIVKECLRDVCESKNAVTNIGKLTMTLSPRTIKNVLPVPEPESLQQPAQAQAKQTVKPPTNNKRDNHQENVGEAEMLECMTVDSNVENHYEISPSVENAMEEETPA